MKSAMRTCHVGVSFSRLRLHLPRLGVCSHWLLRVSFKDLLKLLAVLCALCMLHTGGG